MLIAVSTCVRVPALAQTTSLVSVDSSGTQGNEVSGYYGLALSAETRTAATP